MTHPTWTKRPLALAAATLALTVGLSGCSSATQSATEASPDAYNPVVVAGYAPGNTLTPQNASSQAEWNLVWLLFDGLERVDLETNEVIDEVAESVSTEDQQNWTVKIKEGREFADGQKVTADSFIDAWTYGAQASNGQQLSDRLSVIQGYDELHSSTDPNAEFSGLEKIDDLTFTVALTSKNSSFKSLLTTSAFFPLPASFFEDPEAWVKDPVGNGPHQLRERIDLSTGAYLEVNENYQGSRKPQNTGLYFRFYTDRSAAYQDVVADTVDISAATGADLLTTKTDFGERLSTGTGSGQNQTIQFPFWDDFWTTDDGLKVRQAMSLSINRQEVIDKVFYGFATPSRDFTSKGLPGSDDNLDGSDILDFDVSRAKKLLDEAGGYDEDLPFYYNADGGHKQWVEAVAHQIKANIGINVVPTPVATLSELVEKINNSDLHGIFRSGNIPFYPGLDEMLEKIYFSRASESKFGWTSQEFDDLLTEGRAQSDSDAAIEYYNKTQEVLLRELPAIPLWVQDPVTVYSTKVSNVQTSSFGTGLYLVKKAS